MSRVVLIILAVLAALVVGGVLIWQSFFVGPTKSVGAPRIAIVTDDMLAGAEQAQDKAQAWARQAEERAGVTGTGGATSSVNISQKKGDIQITTEKAPAAEAPAAAAPAADAGMFRSLLADQMEAQINKALTTSRRFAVLDVTTVTSAIFQSARKDAAPAPEEKNESVLQKASAQVRAAVSTNGGSAEASATATGAAPPKDETLAVDRQDLTAAVEKLNATYLLQVSLKEPRATADVVDISKNMDAFTLRLTADPVFVYRLVDVRDNRTILSDSTQLDEPVVVEVRWEQKFETRVNYEANRSRAWREMSMNLQSRVAGYIARNVLDATFPATIRSVTPLVMSRGSNDGVAIGDTVEIWRKDAERKISDRSAGGREVVIDTPEQRIGAARVISVQDNSAQLEPVGTATFAVDDVVRAPRRQFAEAPQATGGFGASPGAGLGKEDVLAAAAAAESGAVRQRVAVGRLNVTTADQRMRPETMAFADALTGRLQQEPRIEILDRTALAQLQSEQNVGGARQTYVRGGKSIAQAGFLVLGDVTVSVERTADVISVPGAAKREISATYALLAAGTLRVTRTDSTVVNSVEVRAKAPISGPAAAGDPESARKVSVAFADAAARALLPRLFPIEVAQLNGATIVLNRGADIGLKTGAVLDVFRIGPPVIDPTTKAQISSGIREKVAQVRIESVQDRLSIARPLPGGGPIEVGNVLDAAAAAAPAATGTRPATSRKNASEAEPKPAVPW